MKRDSVVAIAIHDPLREAVELPLGVEAEFFVAGKGFAGQDPDPSVVDPNSPPRTQPGLWCQWVPNPEGTALVWDGIEKFYDYVEWLKYLIASMLKPWGYTIDGHVLWHGERWNDTGVIHVIRNDVTAKEQHWDPADPDIWLARLSGKRRAS
ncbi:hypothetical protein ACFL59_13315 [Planctomycetota bacterium]